MSAEQEVRRQREALAEAVNRHDVEAVKTFVHPSYVGRTQAGGSCGYEDIIGLAERLLAPDSDFEEAVEVEDVAVSGDRARLTVRRSHVRTGWLWLKHRGTARAVETWWKVDGRWQLVEEQEL
ncbi:MAG: nuclear transport factor 2 family protein [Bryobacteraceae bacterium]|nr:nuclear transport factor 2 family protein [Bryobacteraceae bacterium]